MRHDALSDAYMIPASQETSALRQGGPTALPQGETSGRMGGVVVKKFDKEIDAYDCGHYDVQVWFRIEHYKKKLISFLINDNLSLCSY